MDSRIDDGLGSACADCGDRHGDPSRPGPHGGIVYNIPTGYGLAVRDAPNGVKIVVAGKEEQRSNNDQVTIYGIVSKDGDLWAMVGDNQWVKMTYVRVVTVTNVLSDLIPSAAAPAPKPAALAPAQSVITRTLDLSFGNMNTMCPTDDQMQAMLQLDRNKVKPVKTGNKDIPWDTCKWTLQMVGVFNAHYNLTMPKGWQFTVTMNDAGQTVAVFYGDDGLMKDVLGATIRYRPAYQTDETLWVNNPCGPDGLLVREYNFGQSEERGTLTYPTVPGNISCAGFTMPSLAPVAVSSSTDNSNPKCPKNATETANLLGGKAENWKDLGLDVGRDFRKWSFSSLDFTTLTYPGWGSFDHWKMGNGYKANITGAKDGTFNCTK